MAEKPASETIRLAIISAFALVIALAWNDAIRTFFDDYVIPNLPVPGQGYIYKVFMAVGVTIVAGIGIWLFSRK
jgi:hypothetical protein